VLPVIVENVPLAPLTTLGLGGAARFFAEIAFAAEMTPALTWAKDKKLPVFTLGGGSNVVVADEGFAGLVLRLRTRGRRWCDDSGETRVEVEAGEAWDDVVAEAVAREAAGIECLSGIPGSTGAAPVQNIGAYGQEIASAIRRVRVLDRQCLDTHELDAGACGFGYRDSIFKREPERFAILSVTLALAKNGPPLVRYAELDAALAGRPGLAHVREAVLALRRKKSMVLDEADPNRRSAGSFFTNPVVTAAAAGGLPEDMPRFPLPDGRVKLAAGWLIEHAGLAKGFRMGPVGISSRHALALVHHGGGTTKDLLRLALHVHQTVLDRFGVSLIPEPVFLGMVWPD
jgi:UDP-N-acetylmuramate dehydrogenase